MTDEQFLDFANEMYVFVVEEAYLWELPGGVRDLTADGYLQHGPWRPADCSAALLVWFDAGLLGLLRRWPEEEPVLSEPAAELLRSPYEWVQRPDGSMNVALVATDAGLALPAGDWVQALDVLGLGNGQTSS
jgi:hypothetical protein